MNWTIIAITAVTIAIIAIKALWNEVNRNWDDFSVKSKDRLKNDACDITNYIPRTEYKVQERSKEIKDKELSKVLKLGKSYIARLAEGGD